MLTACPHPPIPVLQLHPSAGLTCLSLWTQAREGGHTVNAGGAWSAGGKGTVIDVLTAVISTPPIHTYTAITPIAVGTGASILTGVGLQQAFIHILCAELPFWGKRTFG
jgi:hypothetical protein